MPEKEIYTNMEHITVRLVGGLGNQLFGYTAGLALAGVRGVDLRVKLHWTPSRVTGHQSSILAFDLPYLPKNQSPDCGLRDSLMFRLERKIDSLSVNSKTLRSIRKIHESDYIGWSESFLDSPSGSTLWGYFQSWKYVELAQKHGFPLRASLRSESKNLSTLLNTSRNLKPIAVHVRRGDYSKVSGFGQLSSKYYYESIRLLRDLGEDGPLWLFSNDDSTREEFPEMEYMSDFLSPAEEMILMSSCHANVLANSTFSWWSAWFNDRASYAIYPDPWFLDHPHISELVPPWWIGHKSAWM